MPAPKPTSISFVGLGYVGLATAACFATNRFRVQGIDIDGGKVASIAKGKSPIREKGLDGLLRKAIRRKSLTVSTSFEGLAKSKVIFITVGTPSKDDGGMNSEFLEEASKQVGRQLALSKGYRLVVVKSTVTPGTTEGVIRRIIERESGKKVGKDIGLVSNPEFLHEGNAINETMYPDAIVIGGNDDRASNALLRLYDLFYKKRPATILTTPSNAEMMKYAINAGRGVQLSFVNTIANLCTRIPGCDYDEVRKGLSIIAKMDQRYLAAGMGFGGSCLPKDLRALAATLRSSNVGDELVSTALAVNEGQVNEAIRLAEKLCGTLDGRRVSVLGLSFKAGTDDVRESVAISLIRALIRIGSEISAYDPASKEGARLLFGNQVNFTKTAKDCLRNAECVFVATAWDEFKELKPADFKKLMASPVVIDGRRIYDHARFEKGGVMIATIGTGMPDGEPGSLVQEAERSEAKPGPKKEWKYEFKGVIATTGAPPTQHQQS